MTWLALLKLILSFAVYVSKFIDWAQIEAAESRGEETGVVRAFLQFSENIDERIAAAKRAGAGAGGMPDIEDDPNNRARKTGGGQPPSL